MSKRMVEGAVAVIPRDRRLLVIRRAQHIPAGGCWCFPGGAIEPGESAERAVIREVQEELGLPVRPIRKLWEWLRGDGRLRLHWWLAEPTADLADMKPDPAEVAEVRWVSLAEFRALEPVLDNNLLFLEHYERTCECA